MLKLTFLDIFIYTGFNIIIIFYDIFSFFYKFSSTEAIVLYFPSHVSSSIILVLPGLKYCFGSPHIFFYFVITNVEFYWAIFFFLLLDVFILCQCRVFIHFTLDPLPHFSSYSLVLMLFLQYKASNSIVAPPL